MNLLKAIRDFEWVRLAWTMVPFLVISLICGLLIWKLGLLMFLAGLFLTVIGSFFAIILASGFKARWNRWKFDRS